MRAIIVHDRVSLLKQGVQLVPDGRIRGGRTGEGVRQREESEQDIMRDDEEALLRWWLGLCSLLLHRLGLIGILRRSSRSGEGDLV